MHALKPAPGLEVGGTAAPGFKHLCGTAHSCSHARVLLLQEIPMNFVDPKEYDIPGLVRKNRYKTILPSEYSVPRGCRCPVLA